MIDILRASSTICSALDAGARCVIPSEQIEQAFELRDQLDLGDVVLGGERQGVLIEGFDLGNTPTDYTPERIGGKTVVFTTTNGTRALHRCRQSDGVLVGCFLNLDAIVRILSLSEMPIHFVCAGTNGIVTAEDCLFAGAVVDGLIEINSGSIIDDASRLCRVMYRDATSNEGLHQAMRDSQGGRNLIALGLDADVEYCSRRSVQDLVPIWQVASNQIEASRPQV